MPKTRFGEGGKEGRLKPHHEEVAMEGRLSTRVSSDNKVLVKEKSTKEKTKHKLYVHNTIQEDKINQTTSRQRRLRHNAKQKN